MEKSCIELSHLDPNVYNIDFIEIEMMMIRQAANPVFSYSRYPKYRFSLKNTYTQSHK